ncbi:MAG: TerC family protein [Actinobacteria bacterium]|nr:TerC family protein [Actinomycetota bacterium]
MDVSFWVWIATLAGLTGVILLDLLLVDAHPHAFGPKEATRWVIFYVALAIAFGIGIHFVWGATYSTQFFAGYITEYSLSVDNLFVFIIIMSAFAVPREHQHRVLLVGVVIALILRGILIAIGAAALSAFSVTFYFFGALLIYTAFRLAKGDEGGADPADNPMVKLAGRFLPTTEHYDGSKLVTRVDGRRVVTPMLMVMIAIGTTDVIFALDSIPAIFGLTQEAYLVFTANAFALMGLRQLFFLVKGLLEKLVYLSYGLAVILGFIGVKLILHALHTTTSLQVPEISTGLSLIVILVVLLITTVVSLIAVRRNPGLISGAQAVVHEREVQSRMGPEPDEERPGRAGDEHPDQED